MYLAVETKSLSLCVYWESESRLNQVYNRDVNTLEVRYQQHLRT